MHSLRTYWHVPLRMPLRDGMEIMVKDSEDRTRTSPDVWKTVNCSTTAQQKDKRRQDNGDEKRLARHHPSNLLHSLTRERIGGGQHGIVSPALRATPFRTFHVLCMRHLMCMRIPSKCKCMWVYQEVCTCSLIH